MLKPIISRLDRAVHGIRGTNVVLGMLALVLALEVGLHARLNNDPSIAAVTKVGNFAGTTIFPAAITGTVNDWAPTGLSTATTIIEAISGTTTLTGLTGGASGRRIDLCNTSANLSLTVAHENVGSVAANRFALADAASWPIGDGGGAGDGMSCASFVYDGTASRWRMVSKTGSTFPQLFSNSTLTVTGTSTLFGTVQTGDLTVTGDATFNNVAESIGALVADSTLDVAGATTLTSTLDVTGTTVLRANVTIGNSSTVAKVIEKHITAPVVSACGGSPTIVGSDFSATVTEGGAATGCTITFNSAYGVAPTCPISSMSGLVFTYTVSTTAITITNVGALSGTKLAYVCVGH